MQLFINSLYIFLIMLVLTFLQKYYYLMLYKILNKTKKLGYFIKIFIRFGIIIHELCHLFFGVIGGSKIKDVQLFNKNGGKVVFETKNYIGSLAQNGHNNYFMFLLVFNQIGIFLTSMGPIIFGIISSYLIVYLLNIDFYNLSNLNFEFKQILVLIIYMIFVPSFILSWQDIKHLLISKQENFGATIVGSIFNVIIFIGFLILFSLIFEAFLIFSILFLVCFILLGVIYLIIFITIKLLKLNSKN